MADHEIIINATDIVGGTEYELQIVDSSEGVFMRGRVHGEWGEMKTPRYKRIDEVRRMVWKYLKFCKRLESQVGEERNGDAEIQ